MHLYIHNTIKRLHLRILVSQCQGTYNTLRPTSNYRQSECPWTLKNNEKAAASDDYDDNNEKEEDDNDDEWVW